MSVNFFQNKEHDDDDDDDDDEQSRRRTINKPLVLETGCNWETYIAVVWRNSLRHQTNAEEL